ncbi:hypothetical protein FH039_11520 [Thermococcus indicus]|uniref:PIN domain-containing protein n=1 Tax=Thermococcus indicus TaxID=2586643 RepID=A0A4Y5SPB0_9EURY|nr:PIN domain-containing protein [Thermococcus indicus]QDA32099.1 hypothetical protein FH039_11520 [Thermococcus indicus]
MEIALDFNLVFSALHSRGRVHLIFAWNYVVKRVTFLVPEYFWEEIGDKWRKILLSTKLSESELSEMLEIIRSQTLTVPEEKIRLHLQRAIEISPDPKDAPYVALALSFNVPLATGDKKLREGLKGSEVRLLTPNDLAKIVLGE